MNQGGPQPQPCPAGQMPRTVPRAPLHSTHQPTRPATRSAPRAGLLAWWGLGCALSGPVMAQANAPATASVSSPAAIQAPNPLMAPVAPTATDPSQAERVALGELRATTLALIDALVEQGLLSRAKADELLNKARSAAATAAATAAAAVPGSAWGQPAKPVVRVPYLSESARAQLKDELRNEVLGTAREEGWTDGRVLPAWVRSIKIEGDLRVRTQGEFMDEENLDAALFRAQTDSPAWAPDLLNTQTDRRRLTLRARLALEAKASDSFSSGLRISTGATSGGPTSASQTLGHHFNRYSIGLDRAWLRWEPRFGLKAEAGRLAVPFDGSDLIWPDDLSLDGVAGRGELDLASGLYGFAVAGAFPLEEFAVSGRDKWLLGGQLGLDWDSGSGWQVRTALGLYDFHNVAGVREDTLPPTGALAGTVAYQLSQYPAAVRQKGNTLINLNAPASTAAPVWGLASRFRPMSLSLGVVAKHWDPVQLGLSVDVVKNTGFDLDDIERRAGTSAVQGLKAKTLGYQARVTVGRARLQDAGDWQAHLAWRHFERDAWVDAYTDTSWHGGGTNYRGFSLGGQYAFDKRATLGLRLISTRNLDDGVRFLAIPGDPGSVSGNLSSAPLKIDTVQLDALVRF